MNTISELDCDIFKPTHSAQPMVVEGRVPVAGDDGNFTAQLFSGSNKPRRRSSTNQSSSNRSQSSGRFQGRSFLISLIMPSAASKISGPGWFTLRMYTSLSRSDPSYTIEYQDMSRLVTDDPTELGMRGTINPRRTLNAIHGSSPATIRFNSNNNRMMWYTRLPLRPFRWCTTI